MPYFGYTPTGTFLHRLDETVASKCPWPPLEDRLAWTACDRLVLRVRGVRKLTGDEAEQRPDFCQRCRKQRRWESRRQG